VTTIQDTLTYADGRLVNGQVVVSWPAFQNNGTPVAGGMQIFPISNGVVSINLYSNVNARPTGVYYTALYELEEGALYTEWWILPNLPIVSLGQVRIAFPATPSAMISAEQLTSAGATYGQFLGWNGSHWVPMNPTLINYTPNTIGLLLTSTMGSDLSVTGTPATLGGNLGLNVPDAGPTSRGVVTTGAQTFAGAKTFSGGINVSGSSSIAGYVPTTRQILTGSGLTGGGDLSADRTLSVVANSVNQKVQVLQAGALIGTRHAVNLLAGTGISLTVADNTGSDWVDVTVASTGAASPVLSVFGRTGAVAAQSGDYAAFYVPLTRQVLAGSGLAGGGALSADVTLSAVPMSASGVGHAAGIVPDPGPTAGSAKFLREDASWNTPTAVQVGAVPTTTQVIAGSGLSGGGALSTNVTLAAVPMGPSGASHAAGIVPDPGATAGAVKFLREDASWAVLVNSFNGRTGAVLPTAGDYTAAQVGAVPTTRQVIAGTGLTGGGALSADVTLSVVNDTTTQRVEAAQAGTLVAARKQLNFIAGAGQTLNVVDNAASNRVDITISSSGTGPATNSIYAVDGAVIGTRPELNLISGTNVTLSGADSSVNNRVDVTVTSTGGGASPLTTKGDVYVFSTVNARLPIGTDNQVLTADSTQTTGLRWATPTAAPVSSVFARTGAITAQSGDYAAFYVPVTRQVLAGTGLTGGGALSADVTLTAKAMGASGASHSVGIVPDPGATAGSSKFLREDATWATPTAAQVGAVPTTTQVVAGSGLSGGGALSANVTLTAVPMGASGVSHAAGIVPDPGSVAGSTRFLCENATWTAPPSAPVTSVFTRTGAITAQSGDYAAFYVPLTTQVIAGSGLSGGGALSANVTLAAVPMGASGAGHAAGIVPDPGATAGSTRYLNENATWATITAAQVGAVPTTTQVIAGAGLSGGGALSANVTLTAVPMGASGASHAAGIVPDPGATAGSTRYLCENATWATPAAGGGTPAAPVGSVQFNNAGAFGGSANLTWDITNSRLGIGYATPAVPLHVLGNVSREVARFQGATDLSNNRNFVSFYSTNNSYWWEISNQDPSGGGTTNGLAFRERSGADPSVVRMHLAQGGNVGIGTASPSALLDVAGYIRTTSLGASAPTTGAGLELAYGTGSGYVQCYDRGASVFKQLNLSGAPVVVGINQNGTNSAPIIACGISTNGDPNFTGNYQLYFFNATSTLYIRVRCSDGVTRQSGLTLA
jgi:hypothetical protein